MTAVLLPSCSTSLAARQAVYVSLSTQALITSASIGSQLIFTSKYQKRDPNPNAEVGSVLYQRYCADCHSNAAKAPPIDGSYNTSPASESDFYIIRYGLKEMKGFNNRLTEFQIFDLLAYLQKSYADKHPQDK